MAKKFPAMTPEQIAFIEHQKIFFVGSAPLSADHRVNVTPKGYDCLRVLSENRVAYLDGSGSGNDTSANLLENGRITFMFCSFET
ncbi:MAG TPA: pyridoxamine 5'-phosphate oxidase family protein, partial [Symbiobacteriaceae bacterium]|nr:pyridoxamine 5'-phosphate oxidase family protein [Symbiobacteriaceae bacterium]